MTNPFAGGGFDPSAELPQEPFTNSLTGGPPVPPPPPGATNSLTTSLTPPPPPPPPPGGQVQSFGQAQQPTQPPRPERHPISVIGDAVVQRDGTVAEERVAIGGREPVVLPSGRTTDTIPGLAVYPMPETSRFDPPRDGYGRYKLTNPMTGVIKSHTRATTMAGALKDAGSLGDWKDRQLIKGLVMHPELVEGLEADLFGTSREYVLNKTMRNLAESARTAAGANDKREFGTAVHAWTEEFDAGTITFDQVPAMFQRHVAVYATALHDGMIEVLPEYIERIVYCPLTDTIGTVDRIYRLTTGELVIGDLKTSSNISYSYPEIAAQLAQYAHASHMLSEDGSTWLEMPPVSKTSAVVAAVPGLPGDRDIHCDLVQINLVTGRALIDLAVAVREARRESKRAVPQEQMIYSRSSDEAMAMMRSGQIVGGGRAALGGGTAALAETTAGRTTQMVHDVVTGGLDDNAPVSGTTVGEMKARIDAATTREQAQALWTQDWPEELVAYAMRRIALMRQ